MIGEIVSHYKVLEKLGGGGMGIIYKAQDLKLDRFVALKFLPPVFSMNEESKLNIIKEAKIAATLEHPNICNIHEVGETEDEQIFIAMAYYEGETLREKIENNSLSKNDIESIILQIAYGLEQAHEKGIVHRDIKPANIFITEQNEVKILDFGVAKIDGDYSVMDAEKVKGTIAYMSPEQISGQEIDKRTDIWAYGVLIYEMITGKKPFRSQYEQSALYSIMNEDPDLSHIPPKQNFYYLEQIIKACLQKNKEARISSFKEIINFITEKNVPKKGMKISLKSSAKIKTQGFLNESKIKLLKSKTFLLSLGIVISSLFIYKYLSSNIYISHPLSVSFVNMENNTNDQELKSVLSDLLTRELSYSPYINVLSNERINELKNRMDISNYSLSEALTISKLANTEVVLATKFLELGETIRIDVEVYDVDTKKRVMNSSIQGKGKDQVFEMISQLSDDICNNLIDIFRFGKMKDAARYETTTDSYAAYKMFTLGQSFRHTDPLKTIILFEQAIQIDPNFIKAYRELAVLVSFHKDDYDSAIEYSKKAKDLSEKKNPAEYLLSLHVESWINHSWQNSINYLKKYLEINSEDTEMKIRLGYILSRFRKQFTEAINIFEEIISLDTNNYSGQLGPLCNYKGYAYLYSGDFMNAIRSFNQAILFSPDKPAAKQNLCSAYSNNGQHDLAIQEFKKVIKEYPEYYPSYAELAATYLKIGKWRTAIELYTQYLNKTPPGITDLTYIKIAWIFLLQKDIKSINSELSKAQIIDSSSVNFHWMKGLVFLEINNNIKEAKSELIKLSKDIDKTYDQEKTACYYHLSGKIKITEGDFQTGIKELRSAEWASPRNFIFFRKELIMALLLNNNNEDALTEAMELNSNYKNDPLLLIMIGDCHKVIGNFDKARKYYLIAKNILKNADKEFLPLTELKRKLNSISSTST